MPVNPNQPGQLEVNSPEIERIVRDRVGAISTDSARTIYAMKFMSDLPPTYRELLPKTIDQDKLSAAEQDIRAQYRNEMATHVPLHAKAMGWTPPAGSADAPSTVQPPLIDMSKMGGKELIAAGLKLSKPSFPKK